ncbi:CHAT domain-containing protein [Mycena capillaripes]|nr:CHAT domain-containing protein [Mycena capillaripes]
MSKLKTVILLHSIRVTSLTHPHDDLPGDMKMFAQLIIEENIFLQTLPVASEQDQKKSWKLGFGCNIPAPTFSVAILRQSETEGTRLIGHVEIGRDEVLGSVELNRALRLQLNKVNADGPSLTFSGGFSVSELPHGEVSGSDLTGMPENTIACVKGLAIATELQNIYEDSRKNQFSMDALQLLMMHEKLLLLRDDRSPVIYHADLGRSLQRRFERLGSLKDINRSILIFESAITLTPDDNPDRPSLLNNLGTSLLSRFKRLGGLDYLNQSILRLEAAITATPDGHSNKPSMLNNLGNSVLSRFKRLGDLDDLNQSVVRFEAAVTLTPDDHPGKPSMLDNLGNSVLTRFKRLGDLNDLNQSVVRFEAAVALTPDSHPDKPSVLNNLGKSLLSRFKRLGGLDDLNQAVTVTPDGHPAKPSMLNNLGNSLLSRFERLGGLNDLNQSVLRFEAAATLTPDDHPDKPSQLSNLGNSLLSRFEQRGDLDDLNQSVLRFKAAATLTPDGHPDMSLMLNNLGSSILSRFERLDALGDLNQSILTFEAAATLTPDGHQNKPSMLNNLGNSLLTRFERLGSLDDLNQSVVRFADALYLTPDDHPDKPSWLSNLGTSLSRRFERLGVLDDLNQSVSRFEAAVALTPEGHPDKPSMLNNLGKSLLSRFKRLGDLHDLNQSVLQFQIAVHLTPDDHPDKPSWLNNLGDSFLSCFERLGSLDDLNQSVLRFEAATTLTPDGHPNTPSMLNSLGSSLLSRFKRLGSLDDLNQSVSRFEVAVNLTPDDHPDKPSRLSNLGTSLLSRFERLGCLDDLNHSVLRFEAAATLTPDGHPEIPSMLNNLGSSLLSRFGRLGDLDDLNQSVFRFESAITFTPDGHPDKPSMLNSLGKSLLSRFKRLSDLNDLNQSVLQFHTAVALTPDNHPDKPSWLINLGSSLHQRFELLHDPQDSQQLLLHHTSAACSATAAASIRFNAAKRWAEYARIYQPSSILYAYTTAIELLPELAWLGLSIMDRHYQLSQAGQVVRDAASAAIAAHDYQKAVEWLEQGRSVIWGQLLHLRTPVDDLRKSHPALANQLASLSTSLETAGTQINAVHDTIQPQSLQSVTQKFHTLALERNLLLQQIRELPGFERFLLARPISELSVAAKMGPVAILNISAHGCDALILMPGLADEVTHVPLSDFTISEAEDLATYLASIVGSNGRGDGLGGLPEEFVAPDDIVSHILSELWVKIVHPVLNALAITTPVSQDLRRIWWCPTGPLAFLPIHAAGLYGQGEAFGSKLSDFLISSYTPSLTALIQGSRPQSESQSGLQLLAVSQTSAIGQSYIPGTLEEIRCVKQHVKGKIPVLWLDKDMATIENVQQGMKDSRWVHFACHGVQKSSPTESALLLAGSSQLTLSNIIQLSLPNADLAFLSACQTATGSKELQDESVHLAAGMLLAGYRGVIGTMWSIMDNDAPQVAGDVYARLLETSAPDPTRAAEALHFAVQKFREQPGAKKSFLHWVPFIHFGV